MNLSGAEYDIAKKVQQVWEEARAIYQLDDVPFNLVFLNNARMNQKTAEYNGTNVRDNHTPAGMALMDKETRAVRVYINRRAVKQEFSHMLNEVVPHEIAHLVCMLKPHFGNEHDEGWSEVCVRLGGTGKVTYDTEFDLRRDRRVRRQFIYSVGPRRVRLSETWHNKIQNGGSFTNDSGTVVILKEDFTGAWL